MNNLKTIFVCFSFIILTACNMETNSNNAHQDNMDLATAWVTAGYTGKAEATEMVEKNMSEDGMTVGDRYVGMGFIWDPEEEGMTVTYIIPESPASKALKVGDSFVEVAGVRVSEDNRNRLGFRGKPGEEINAVVLRDDEEVAVTVARGAVQQTSTKAQILENFAQADAEDWGPNQFEIIETACTDDGTVWVLSWSEFTEDASGLTANAYRATRFEFNDEGKVSWVGNLSEDRFILEQQGYSISR
ncbi:PDZ domain-containing protein [Gammaproteobacteria bacterium]|nr:PDZ domain-containing protein [Gammaproteobacteria bacterium]